MAISLGVSSDKATQVEDIKNSKNECLEQHATCKEDASLALLANLSNMSPHSFISWFHNHDMPMLFFMAATATPRSFHVKNMCNRYFGRQGCCFISCNLTLC